MGEVENFEKGFQWLEKIFNRQSKINLLDGIE